MSSEKVLHTTFEGDQDQNFYWWYLQRQSFNRNNCKLCTFGMFESHLIISSSRIQCLTHWPTRALIISHIEDSNSWATSVPHNNSTHAVHQDVTNAMKYGRVKMAAAKKVMHNKKKATISRCNYLITMTCGCLKFTSKVVFSKTGKWNWLHFLYHQRVHKIISPSNFAGGRITHHVYASLTK